MSHQQSAEAERLVRDLGEFGLIQLLQQRIAARGAGRAAEALELGVGDDAAVWRPTPGAVEVITTDALIEDVHFRLRTTSWRDLGWKALAVNVSDLAAMGAAPRYALVTLGLRPRIAVADLLALYDGMLDLAERFGVEIIGGDIVASPVFMLSITAVGEAAGPLLRRDAGQPGDLLAVTGTLGAARGGLRLLEAGRRPPDGPGRLYQAQLRPVPRVAEGAALVGAGVRCGMDVSDGLFGDTTRICERSGVAAVIEAARVPVDPSLAAEFPDQALRMALGGGEDYELLCAAPPAVIERATRALAEVGTPLTVVGRLESRQDTGPLARVVGPRGEPLALDQESWDHFRG